MKLKTTHAMALCALSLLATQPVWALGPAKPGEFKDLVVRVSIETNPCAITLSNTVKFNDILTDTIGPDQKGTDLGKPDVVNVKLDCFDTQTALGLGFTDNQLGTSVPRLQIVNPIKDTETLVPENSYGLGKINEQPIGAYLLGIFSVQADGLENMFIRVTDTSTGKADGTPRSFSMITDPTWRDAGKILAFYAGADESDTPAARKLYTAKLQVRATMTPLGQLQLNAPTPFQAGTKLTVWYF